MTTRNWLFLGVMILSLGAYAGCEMSHGEKEEKEGAEVKVPADQLPPAVKATFARESGGTAITEADKEDEDGKTIYEADVKIGGQNYEIKVAADGTLVSKKADNEENEKKGEEKEKK